MKKLSFFLVCVFVASIPVETLVVVPGVGTLSKLVGAAAFGASF